MTSRRVHGQTQVSARNHWASSNVYRLEQQRCLCYGKKPSSLQRIDRSSLREPLPSLQTEKYPAHSNHRVYVAFLRYSNEEYQEQRSLRDRIFPMNWLTTVATGSDLIHCQLVFWDELRKQYYTFSVDDRRPVHVYDKKKFQNGWRFVALDICERQELMLHNFCVQQLGKPLNYAGQLSVLVWAQSGYGESWFCSELVTAALAHAGVIDFDQWPGIQSPEQVTPANLFCYLTEACVTCKVTLLPHNPVSLQELDNAAARAGPITRLCPDTGLPISVAAHVAETRQNTTHMAHQNLEQQRITPLLQQHSLLDTLASIPLSGSTVNNGDYSHAF